MEPTVITEIEAGIHDNILNEIYKAVLARKSLQRNSDSDPLDPTVDLQRGDTVVFNSTIRPKYLVGKTATVKKINPKSVVVTCPIDPAYGRFSGSQNVRCPKSLIEGRIR